MQVYVQDYDAIHTVLEVCYWHLNLINNTITATETHHVPRQRQRCSRNKTLLAYPLRNDAPVV